MEFAAASFKKAVLNAAASSNVRGGQSRVFARPGKEAFAITAMPQNATSRLDSIRRPQLVRIHVAKFNLTQG
jgi:hypothetical protein